ACGDGTTVRIRAACPAGPWRRRAVAGPGRCSPAVTACWPGAAATIGRPRVALARRLRSPAVIALIVGLPVRTRVPSHYCSIRLQFDRMLVRFCCTPRVRHFCDASNRCLMSSVASANVGTGIRYELRRWAHGPQRGERHIRRSARGWHCQPQRQDQGQAGRQAQGKRSPCGRGDARAPRPQPRADLAAAEGPAGHQGLSATSRLSTFDAGNRRGGRPDQHLQRLVPAFDAAEQGLPAPRCRAPGHPAIRPEAEEPEEARAALDIPSQDAAYVPWIGRIAAGGPILAEEAIEDIFPLPKQLVGNGTLFLLKVTGDSMINAAIADGD